MLKMVLYAPLLLTPCSRVLREKLISSQPVKKSPHFMEAKVHWLIYKCASPVPILSHFNPVPACHSTSWRSIFPSTPGFSKWSLYLRFPHQNHVYNFSPPIHATCPAHLIILYSITRVILGEEYGLLSSTLFSFIYSPVTSSLLGPNILLSSLFSNTLSLCSSLNVSDQVSHPYKTTGKSLVLCTRISIFVFLDSNLEEKRFCTEW